MRKLAAVLLLVLVPCGVPAADAPGFSPAGDFDPDVPSPASLLGFELGERPASHAAIVDYAEWLTGTSPLVKLERYGKTHEGRDLIYLLISSERNLARLDAIRESLDTLADPRRPLGDGALGKILDDTPAVAFLAYSIHGDELSSSDAALALAYKLAADRSPEAAKLRDELVVLIDPLQNPDGRERFLAMTATWRGQVPNPDPDSLAHTASWPWGRGNHYFFDLNRDWFTLVQPESRGKAAILKRWHPQLLVDSHEMGSQSTYLFTPPRAPFNPNWPAAIPAWWETFAADQARAFDARGWSYYTREWHEEFFPGYGSSFALYSGAVGILYEQAGTDGGPVRKRYGGTLTYAEAVEHQYVSSLANLGTAATNRRRLLERYRKSRQEALARGGEGPARAYYFVPSPDPARAARLASRLAALDIEVEWLTKPGVLKRARSYWEDGASKVSLPVGTFRVRLEQPNGLTARALLEHHTAMPDSFLAEEREHLERQKGSRIYDTTGWSPLVASGLETWWSKRLDKLSWKPLETIEVPEGRVYDLPGAYGWAFDGSTDGAVVLAGRLAAEGLTVRVGNRPFELARRAYPRGSFLVRAEENAPSAGYTLRKLAGPLGVAVDATPTARIQRGPDLGGGHWLLMKEPRIALLGGSPASTASVGAAWHLLDHECGLRVSLIDTARLGRTALERYNVLIVPDAWGGAEAWRQVLGEQAVRQIRRWVEAGGTLVGLGAGSFWLAERQTGLSEARPRNEVFEAYPAPRFGLDDGATAALERLQATGVGRDGKAVTSAGPYSEDYWPKALGIPGPGSPVLGRGSWALLGEAGDAARKRGPLEPAGAKDPEEPQIKEGEDARKARLEREDKRLRRFHPSGAMLRVDLDPEHWLAFGSGDRVAVMTRAADALIARDPVDTVGRYAAPDHLHVGGLLWPESAGRIALTAWLTREKLGKGQVILFADDPNFRGYFLGSSRIFLNAVLLGPGAGTTHTVPW